MILAATSLDSFVQLITVLIILFCAYPDIFYHQMDGGYPEGAKL